MYKILDRLADASGILCALLVMVGFVGLVSPFMPETLDSPDAVHAHLTAHPPSTTLWLGLWLEGVGLALLVVLAARIAARIRATRPDDWLPAAAVGFAVASLAVKIGSFAPAMAALDVDRYDPATVTALLGVNSAAHELSTALDIGMLLLLGLGALATRALPRWLAALTVLAGLADLFGVVVPSVAGLLHLVFMIWLTTVSGWLLRRGDRTPSLAPEPAHVG
jgi:hypothetical protein